MLSAQSEELERQRRLMELKKSLLKENAAGLAAKAAAAAAAKITSTTESSSSADAAVAVKSEPSLKTVTTSAGTSPPKEKDSQLKSLLQGLISYL